MKMQKRQFRIGELAEQIGVKRFVVRFWEKEFDLLPTRSTGGQRFYETKDLEKLLQIKDLLYNKGLTISGAKKILKNKHAIDSPIIASQKTTIDAEPAQAAAPSWPQLREQLIALRSKLVAFQELL